MDPHRAVLCPARGADRLHRNESLLPGRIRTDGCRCTCRTAPGRKHARSSCQLHLTLTPLAFDDSLLSTLEVMVNTEDAWKSLHQTTDLIKVADTKAGAILAADGVLGGALLRTLPAPNDWSAKWLYVTLLLGGLGLVILSAVSALSVFAPRLSTDRSRSLLYFANIARRYSTSEDFATAYRDLLEDGEQLQLSLTEQVWATSRIARRKFRAVTPAVWTFGAALVVALAAGWAGLFV